MSSHQPSSIPCNLCGSSRVATLSNRSRSGRPLRSVACTACGLVWSDPRPHEVRRFYEEDYRLDYKGTFQPRPRHVLRAGRVALDRLRKIAEVLKPASRVLDVGSGGGEFAYLLKTLGHAVVGVEPNRGYAGFSRGQYGLQVLDGFITDVQLPQEGFDLITIWHVLEHTEDPGAVLRRLRGALRPDGRLVVEVPNVQATCQSPRSSFHEAHLYTFSPRTLERLAAREGLRLLDVRFSPDGGNITMRFAPDEQPVTDPALLRLPGHFEEVARTVKNHTAWSHALSSHPWRRAAGRLRRMVSEGWHARGGANGKALLDALYGAELRPATNQRPRAAWGWLLAAYAGAVLAEEVLLDRVMPGLQLGTMEGLAVYAGLQAAVVAGLFFTLGRKLGSRRELLKAGACVAPLFAVPAVC